MPLGNEEILNRFGFHKATIEGQNATAPKHADLRAQFIEFASTLDVLIPDGRYKDYLFYELENASMWAHKAIAGQAPLEVYEMPKLPHSRACGVRQHGHGSDCHPNCPTCGGNPNPLSKIQHYTNRDVHYGDGRCCKELNPCTDAASSIPCMGEVRNWYFYPNTSGAVKVCERHADERGGPRFGIAVDGTSCHTVDGEQPAWVRGMEDRWRLTKLLPETQTMVENLRKMH